MRVLQCIHGSRVVCLCLSVCVDMSMCMTVNMYMYFGAYICMYVGTFIFVSECVFVLFKPLSVDLCSMRNVPANEIHRFINVLKASISYKQSSVSIFHKQALIGIG